MDAVAVVRSSTDGTWEYSPKALWPDATDLYAFYAYSPANSRNVDPAMAITCHGKKTAWREPSKPLINSTSYKQAT